MNPWAIFGLGAGAGFILATVMFAVWTVKITREERLAAQAQAGCTPEWCPLMIDTEKEAEKALASVRTPCCKEGP